MTAGWTFSNQTAVVRIGRRYEICNSANSTFESYGNTENLKNRRYTRLHQSILVQILNDVDKSFHIERLRSSERTATSIEPPAPAAGIEFRFVFWRFCIQFQSINATSPLCLVEEKEGRHAGQHRQTTRQRHASVTLANLRKITKRRPFAIPKRSKNKTKCHEICENETIDRTVGNFVLAAGQYLQFTKSRVWMKTW